MKSKLLKSRLRLPFAIVTALLLLLGGQTWLGVRAAQAQPASEDRPNIVFIFADDLGYGDIEPYGQEKINTPNLQRMAEEGLKFTQFYAGATVCAPSRSVLMTGLNMGRTPVRGNNPTYDEEGVVTGQTPLPAEVKTVAEVLHDAGYRTGGFGKWGLGGLGTEGVPHKQGFDEFYGYLDQWRAHYFWPEYLIHNTEKVPLEGNEVETAYAGRDIVIPGAGQPIRKGTYSHDWISERALDFIEESQDEPFFLYVPSTIPHKSLQAPQSAMEQYLDDDGESVFPPGAPHPEGHHYSAQDQPRATYAAMISRLDREVGRILDKLQEEGLAENTIVFFTSDNGPPGEGEGSDPAFFNSNGPLHGFKGEVYEGGIRVPMIAWWPGRVPAGETTDLISYAGDFMTTAAELAGARLPDKTGYLRGASSREALLDDLSNRNERDPLDSISLVPTLLGRPEEQEKHEYLYWESYINTPKQAVRMGQWKAIRTPMMTGDIQLFNLEKHILERRDVSAINPDVVKRIDEIMKESHTPSPLWSATK
jgi:arylsulfatase A-like enzyme